MVDTGSVNSRLHNPHDCSVIHASNLNGSPSILFVSSKLILAEAEYTIPFILILSASAILNFTALYGASMLGLGMYLEASGHP